MVGAGVAVSTFSGVQVIVGVHVAVAPLADIAVAGGVESD
jgi:hypothetical protein